VTGIAVVTLANPGSRPGRFPIIAAGDLPFHDFRSHKRLAGSRCLADPIKAATAFTAEEAL
jgi:hypothetical protein